MQSVSGVGRDTFEASPELASATLKEDALRVLETLVPGTAANNISFAFAVPGRLAVPAVQNAVTLLLRRYDILRTVFTEQDGLRKRVLAPDDARVTVEEGEYTEENRQGVLDAFAARPFAIDGEPLARIGLFHGAAGDVFCLVVHHLVFDTVSTTIFLTEFSQAYRAYLRGEAPPAELLERVAATPEVQPTEASLAYWRQHVSGVNAAELEMWCGKPDLAQPTLVGDQVSHLLSDQARAALKRLEKEMRAPEAVVLLAAYCLLLARHGAGIDNQLGAEDGWSTADLVVGTPVNVRGPQTSRAIGYHINTLPLRVKVGLAAGFRDLVADARRVFFEAIRHADVPVDLLLPEVTRGGAQWRTTLFRHMFNYVPAGGLQPFDIAGMRAVPIGVENGYSKFDLEFFVLSTAEGVRVRAVHYTEVLDRTDVELLLDRYDALLVRLGQAGDAPLGGLDISGDRDRSLIETANRTDRPVEPATVLEAVAARVAADPGAVAVRAGDRAVTRGQLWRAAQVTRDRLVEHGVTPGDVVALAAPRGPELAASVLGVWLAGCAYLPLDPEHPAARIAYQLDDSGARAVIGELAEVATLPMVACTDQSAVAGAVAAPEPTSCAYLIYTSGSTGAPKGTMVSHGNLANLVTHFADQLRATPDDATLWLTTFAFDISALELFLPLVTGGRLVAAPDEARTDGTALRDAVEAYGVDIVQATPTSWRLVVEQAGPVLSGRRVLCGGEPLPLALARQLAGTGCELWNVYGPTETTIWSTAGRIGPQVDAVDVGRPIANTRIFVADPAGRALPVGVRGELCIAGAGVALGYHDRPELTAQRFGDHPDFGRFYRTGDLARWRPDGTLEVLGRGDRQIKLRGNRIELGEVETVLASHPDVKAAAVVVVGDPSADAILVAFVEAPEGAELADGLWQHARDQLPRSSVPHEFVVTGALPTNANGKVDYPALTRLAAERRARPGTPGQDGSGGNVVLDVLLSLWRELLDRTDVTADSNFFVNGGHSLLAAQLVQRLETTTGVRLKLADVFANPTPASLAEQVRTAEPGHAG